MADCYENLAGSSTITDRSEPKNGEASSVSVSGAIGTSRIEETTPDLLKNTPSNIARLVDEIEQCKGRQKYLAQTRSPSDGGDVRWYFCKVPLAENELAASVPRTEVVGKGEYFRFGTRDSLAIEASFLQREEELLSCWWKEYAECSEGPRGQPSSSKKLDREPNVSSSEGVLSTQSHEVEEERVGVPVKGGLYEVDLVKRHSFPVYWSGDNRRVLRGQWFARKGGLDWFPLREDVTEQLEIAYHRKVWRRRTFQLSGLFAARVDLQGSTLGLHALFTGEDDTWEAWLNVDASGFSSVVPLGGGGIKLRRGYLASNSPKPTQDELRQQKEEEMDDYCSQVPVRHLVFMVHGIGQRLEKSNLVDDVGTFRNITASLAERHLTSHQRSKQRVLFIPCQWRKGLMLSGETAVEKITLDGVRGLRVMLSATAHDVLYYMSPIYCQDIINSVSNQLNQLYLKFLKRNPDYDGKVSIYAHSLGSVLSYDILCHQENLSSPFPMDQIHNEHTKGEKPSNDRNNQSSTCESLSSPRDKSSFPSKETEDCLSPINVNQKSASPTLLIHEENGKNIQCNPRDNNSVIKETENATTQSSVFTPDDIPPSLLVHEEVVTKENAEDTISPEQKSGEEDVQRTVNYSRDIVLNNGGSLDEPARISCGELCDDTDNKEKVIELLKKEIDSLKVKIFESQHGGQDGSLGWHEGKEVPATVLKQPTPEKLPSGRDDSSMSYTPYIKYTKLEFEVDTFFAVGSPLGVFLALRNIRIGIGKGEEYWGEENISEEMPACRRMFNVFHPFDPVAYRIEPLVCKEYIGKRPAIVPYHKGGRRLHIGFQEFKEDLATRSQAMLDHLSSIRTTVLTVCQSRNLDGPEEGEENDQDKEETSYGSLMMERVTGSTEGRIDHMLQDKTFQHPYIAAIGSHTNYWRDFDTALFILKHLYRDIAEEPLSPEEFNGENSKNESGSAGLSGQRETIDEELPLTFSDKGMVRSFSSNVRQLVKKH
ncbi:hypothetical protein UlMin_010922 [Ulmus minor]